MARAAAAIPSDWDYVLDNPRRSQPVHSAWVPGFADWWPIADDHLRAVTSQGYCGIPPQPPATSRTSRSGCDCLRSRLPRQPHGCRQLRCGSR